MKRRTVVKGIGLAGVLPGLAADLIGASELRAAPAEGAVYELRVYTAAEGKLPELLKRFREHTVKLFERHGMKNVAYWTATDEPKKTNTLIYILKYPSREAATASWKAFQDDPEWQKVRGKSEENGKLVEKVDSTFMELTDFSAKLG
jgi:NIPSNAP